MKISYDLMLRTINRFNEIGGFEMKCLDKEFDTPEDAFLYFVNMLGTKDPNSFNEAFRHFMFMSDRRFNRPWNKGAAKLGVGLLDMKHRINTELIFEPWNLF